MVRLPAAVISANSSTNECALVDELVAVFLGSTIARAWTS